MEERRRREKPKGTGKKAGLTYAGSEAYPPNGKMKTSKPGDIFRRGMKEKKGGGYSISFPTHLSRKARNWAAQIL